MRGSFHSEACSVGMGWAKHINLAERARHLPPGPCPRGWHEMPTPGPAGGVGSTSAEGEAGTARERAEGVGRAAAAAQPATTGRCMRVRPRTLLEACARRPMPPARRRTALIGARGGPTRARAPVEAGVCERPLWRRRRALRARALPRVAVLPAAGGPSPLACWGRCRPTCRHRRCPRPEATVKGPHGRGVCSRCAPQWASSVRTTTAQEPWGGATLGLAPG